MTKRWGFRHAIKWAYVMTWGQRGIALLVMIILAVALGPRDFGTVAMATAYIVFIEMFVAQGFGAAIIQRKELARELLDSVFWLIIAASIVLTAASVALSPWWASVNGLPELAPVITALSLSIPIKGMTVVQHALLQRRMDFRNLALLGGASSIIGGTVGISMAFSGCGVWSLVAWQLIRSVLATIVMWLVSDWRPRLRFSVRDARGVFGFSGGVFASQLGVYIAAQSDAVLMGIFFGPIAVGLYRLAERFMAMLLEVATRSIQVVALPHFSNLQDDPEGLKRAVLSCIRLSATITIPAMALLAAVGDQFMGVLGAKWAPAANVLKIIVLIGIVKAVALFTGPLLLAMGRAKTVAILVWALAIVTAGAIAAVGATLKGAAVEQQIMVVALTRTGLFVLLHGVVSLMITKWLCRISIRQFASVMAPGVIAAAAAVLTANAISGSGLLVNLPAMTALFAVALPTALTVGITLIMLDQSLRQAVGRMLHLMLWWQCKAVERAFGSHQE